MNQSTSSKDTVQDIIKQEKVRTVWTHKSQPSFYSHPTKHHLRLKNSTKEKCSENIINCTGRSFTVTETLACNRDVWRELVRYSTSRRPNDHIWSWDR